MLRVHSRGFVAVTLACGLALSGCSQDPEVLKREHVQRGDAYLTQQRYDEAVREYRSAVQQDPRFAAGHYKLGEAYIASNDGQNALASYLRAAELDPKHADAQLKAVNLLLLARRYADARVRARAVLQLQPENASALVALGNALAGLRSFDEALAATQRAAALDPLRSGSQLNLGLLQFVSGNPTAALAAFRRATEIAPNAPETHLGLATFYWANNQTADAERAFLQAVEVSPRHTPTHRELAAFYVSTGRPELAERHLRTVVDIADDMASRIALSEFYVSVARIPDGIRILERLTAENKEAFAPAKIRIAMIQSIAGQRASANRTLDEVLLANPKEADAMAIKAHLLLGESRLQEARTLSEAAVATNRQSLRAQFALGKVMRAFGRVEDAQRAFREVLQLDRGASEARIELSQMHLDRREVDSGIQLAQEAVDTNPWSVDARVALARALMVRPEDLSRASAQVALLTQTFPRSAQAQHLLGELEEARGATARARTAYDRALQFDPTFWDSLNASVTLDVNARQFESARRRVAAALAQSPSEPAVLLLAARTAAAGNDNAAAEQHLKKVIALDPSNLKAYQALAAVYLLERQLDRAQTEFIEIARRQPQAVAPPTMVGIIAEARNDRRTAIEWYNKALAIDSSAAAAANNLAWLLAERGDDLDTALQLAQVAKAGLPAVPDVADTLAWVYYKRDMISLAVPIMERVVEANPKHALYHFHLGMIYVKRGEDNKARQALQRALELQPDFAGAAEAKAALNKLLY